MDNPGDLHINAENCKFTLAVEGSRIILGVWMQNEQKRVFINFHTSRSILGFLNMFRKVEL